MFSGNPQAPSRWQNSRARLQEPEAAQNEAKMVRILEATGRYQILRKLEPRKVVAIARRGYPLRGVILDTEQQPSVPIPQDIIRLTGITDVMVRGKLIDMPVVRALVEPADLIIAHNAGFDRPFCEALSPIFARKAWACSNSEIDWGMRCYEGTKLGHLINQSGYFHVGHRAVDDCFTLLEVLARSREDSHRSPFAKLYNASRRSRVHIFAENAPFDLKDLLKARGYRWSDGSDGRPKSWWIEIAEETMEAELRFLRSDIYRWKEADPPVQRLTAFDRFRARR